MSNNTIARVLTAVVGFAAVGAARADVHFTSSPKFNMPEGVTPISHEVYGLHMLMFWICVVIGLLVFGVMGYSMWKHRQSRGHQAAHFHESAKVEIAWTIVPFLILIGMAIPAAATLVKMNDFSQSKMSVKVTGYQWLWHYKYMDKGVSFYSKLSESSNKARQLNAKASPWSVKNYLLDVDHPLVLPTHTKIQFLITSGDVIHSWWVPELGFKQDAIPGYVNRMWAKIEKPGIYRGQCAELCGRGHAYMPIEVKAVPPEQFKKWLASRSQGKQNKGEVKMNAQAEHNGNIENDKNKGDENGEKESGQAGVMTSPGT